MKQTDQWEVSIVPGAELPIRIRLHAANGIESVELNWDVQNAKALTDELMKAVYMVEH